MTQAFNLAQLANNLNTSGQLDATDGLSGVVPLANGGTGQSSLTANSVLLGNGTSGILSVAPSTSGNILTSNGTTWVSSAPQVTSNSVRLPKAWVLFDGTSRTILSSYNVSSISAVPGRNNAYHFIAFTTALANSNYTVQVSVGALPDGLGGTGGVFDSYTAPTTTQFPIYTINYGGTGTAYSRVSVVVFGD